MKFFSNEDILVVILSCITAPDRASLAATSHTMSACMREYRSTPSTLVCPCPDINRYTGCTIVETRPRRIKLNSSTVCEIDRPTIETIRGMLRCAGEHDIAWFMAHTRTMECSVAGTLTVWRNVDWTSPQTHDMVKWCSEHTEDIESMVIMSFPSEDPSIFDDLIRKCAKLTVKGSIVETQTHGGINPFDSESLGISGRLAPNLAVVNLSNYDFFTAPDIHLMCEFIRSSTRLVTLTMRNILFSHSAWVMHIMDAISESSSIQRVSLVSLLVEEGPLLHSSALAERMVRMCRRISHVEIDYVDVFSDDEPLDYPTEPAMVQTVIMRRTGMVSLPFRSPYAFLESLDISYNNICELAPLAAFIRSCPTLRSLRLRANMISDCTMNELGDGVLNQLSFFDVSDNFLTESSLHILLASNVQHILADANSIRASLHTVYKATQQHYSQHMRYLSVRGNPIIRGDDEVIRELLRLHNLIVIA